MTAQVADIVFYRGKPYSLAGVSGQKELYEPKTYGMKPVGICTACWRGYQCEYAVDHEKLILRNLAINLDLTATMAGISHAVPISATELFGVSPVANSNKDRWFQFEYKGMTGPIPYSGGLLIADDFIRELYVHMGFHPAWKYREVHELIFEQGKLESAADRSEQMAQLREGVKRESLELGRDAKRTDIEAWVDKSFSLKYS
jgi:hypothetical protein